MILKLIGLSEDPDLVSYHEGTSIVYNPNSQEFMLYKGTQIEETIAFSDYSEPDCGHKVVAYLMENGKTVDRYVSEPTHGQSDIGEPEDKPNKKSVVQIPEDTIVARFWYNGVPKNGIDLELDDELSLVMKNAGFVTCGTGYDLENNVRDLVFDREITK